MLLTRAPVAARSIATAALPLDLHVLSLPLAFILSQDQTLRCLFFFFFSFYSLFKPELQIFSATVLAGRISFSVVFSRCLDAFAFIGFTVSSAFARLRLFTLFHFVTGTSFNNVPCASALIVSSKLYLPQHVNDLLSLYGPPLGFFLCGNPLRYFPPVAVGALLVATPFLLPKATAKLLRLFFLHKYFCNFFCYFFPIIANYLL